MLHIVVNVKSAQYFNTPQLRELHAEAIEILKLQPTTSITIDNVAETEDDTLPSQRSGLYAVVSSNKQKAKHLNCTAEYWLKNCANRKIMVEKCREHGIGK